MNIRIAGEISESIVDGPGIRYVVFTQGCPHHCVGCHNPETHDFDKGTSIDVDEICSRFAKHPYMSGLTISGGEPFAQKSAILSGLGFLCWESSRFLHFSSVYSGRAKLVQWMA